MQENEFEKQLKKMMEELNLLPSETVWDKLSRRLNKNRRRKTPLFILLTVCLIFSGYFIFHVYNNHKKSTQVTISNKTNKFKQDDSFKLNNPGNLIAKKYNDKKGSRIVTLNNKVNIIPSGKSFQAKNFKPVKPADTMIKTSEDFALINDSAVQTPVNYLKSNLQQLNAVIAKQRDDKVLLSKNQFEGKDSYNNKMDYSFQPKKADSKDLSVSENAFINKQSDSQPAIIQNKTATSSSHVAKQVSASDYTIPKWQLGITASYGRSNAIEKLVDLDKPSSDFYSSPGTTTGGNRDTSFTAHPYTVSNAYQFGIAIQKKIIKKGSISTGLNFIHLSTKSNVGEKIDSTYILQNTNNSGNSFSLDSYYKSSDSATNGNASINSNNYNFIELPVYFQQNFLQKKNFSLSYNAGFSIRQLISSHSLIYNQANNIYFSKDDLLRKTQFQFMAGLNFTIKTGKTTALYIGPQFSYSISNLLNDDAIGTYHLVIYGLQAGLLFHKK